jgi:hypothetical protein
MTNALDADAEAPALGVNDAFFELRDRAYTLAGSGRFKRWDQVAYALLAEGFLKALITRLNRDALAVMMINRSCVQARAK